MLLNQQATLLQHIEPRNGQEPDEEQFWRDDRYRPERGDWYIPIAETTTMSVTATTDVEKSITEIGMSVTTPGLPPEKGR